jgi:hypothetical protein
VRRCSVAGPCDRPNPAAGAQLALVQAIPCSSAIVNASGTFLPVFLLRLGRRASDVGLLTALPGLTAFALAIPFGRWLQRRRNIVPWYSRLRLVAWSSYAVMAGRRRSSRASRRSRSCSRSGRSPRCRRRPAWSRSRWSWTAPPVRDGRFDLLGRRWAIAGVTAAIAVALGGQFLSAVAFPTNFEICCSVISLAGLGSYPAVEPDRDPGPGPVPTEASTPVASGSSALWRLIVANRSFVRFELRSLLYTSRVGLSMPVLPLFYVHEVGAPDAWIGVIGAAASPGACSATSWRDSWPGGAGRA